MPPFEASHGKPRPTLERLSDTPKVSARLPVEGRDAKGHFLPGNRHSVGNGAKAAISRLLGPERRARQLYRAIIRELPWTGFLVRTQVVAMVRETLAAADLGNAAAAAGLHTPAGAALDERATVHGQRAERLSVTVWGHATKRVGIPEDEPANGLTPFAIPKGGR